MSSTKISNQNWIRAALREAKKGVGDVSPNPAVGAVIVERGRIVARGHHRQFGGPHAEIEALETWGRGGKGKSRAAAMAVTLEPCNHFGKTPPCTEAIIRSGIRHVIVGMLDPNKIVAGRGVARLRRAGIRVDLIHDPDVLEFYEPYRTFHQKKRSYVTLKLAMSIDGKIGSKKVRWITGPKALDEVQKIRSRVDAILVGRKTAIQDNPRLTLRGAGARRRSRPPVRIILTTQRNLPRSLKLFRDRMAPTWILAGGKFGQALDIGVALRKLAHAGVVHLLVEGGAETARSFLSSGNVDEMILFVSPKRLRPDGMPAFLRSPDSRKKSDAGMRLIETRRVGKDILFHFKLKGE